MTIRADSYGSVAGVSAFTKRFFDGTAGFNSTTQPTLTEIESFIDQASSLLNVAIRKDGFSPANIRANSTAKLSCDVWVNNEATILAELTQGGVGFSDAKDSRTGMFKSLFDNAMEFVEDASLGWDREGITKTNKLSQGLKFTAEDAQADRSDPKDETLEQPLFRRDMFDGDNVRNPT